MSFRDNENYFKSKGTYKIFKIHGCCIMKHYVKKMKHKDTKNIE